MSTSGANTPDPDPTTAVRQAYRLILGRTADAEGEAHYVDKLRTGELTTQDVCAALAGSDEFAGRLAARTGRDGTGAAARSAKPADPDADAETDPDADAAADTDAELIDPAQLIERTSVEELAATAEAYFASLDEPELLLTKPFKDAGEAAELLVTFGQALRGLQPAVGMTVLDFGAGTCWTSRWLTQLGCRVIATDVSPSALELGRELYARAPVLGSRPEPEFLVFDGHHIDLPDASVDRVLSYDALHHVPNPDEVIAEFARVLRPGGIAAFSEPGETHSRQPQSQYEMRHFGVLENDIVIEEVWRTAQRCGFAELRLCLLDSAPQWVDLPTFRDVLDGVDDPAGPTGFPERTRAAIGDRRMFTLRRAGSEPPDSRMADGLTADLTFEELRIDHHATGTTIRGTCRAANTGTRTWLPSDAEYGPVHLGARIRTSDGAVSDRLAHSGGRIPLPGRGVAPGEEVTIPVRLEVPTQVDDVAAIEFDLVSELVCWFSVNGSHPVTVPLT
ncbi:methyltransferase domain-containing protein [Prauserella rugosa]|uniref:Uncharacterized protein DUF4214 n=1 Tax=Prauserella rugosa TaxID=43354 RepID=A0A660CAG3_9PSEU|nr:methyltransferase domain-containing protein [Prauserella rugosa]TWH18519.1 uncharacterized protein DUF4214 [Prauserella rugosa]